MHVLCAIDSHWDIWHVLCVYQREQWTPVILPLRVLLPVTESLFLKDAVTFLRNKKQAKYSPNLDPCLAEVYWFPLSAPTPGVEFA